MVGQGHAHHLAETGEPVIRLLRLLISRRGPMALLKQRATTSSKEYGRSPNDDLFHRVCRTAMPKHAKALSDLNVQGRHSVV